MGPQGGAPTWRRARHRPLQALGQGRERRDLARRVHRRYAAAGVQLPGRGHGVGLRRAGHRQVGADRLPRAQQDAPPFRPRPRRRAPARRGRGADVPRRQAQAAAQERRGGQGGQGRGDARHGVQARAGRGRRRAGAAPRRAHQERRSHHRPLPRVGRRRQRARLEEGVWQGDAQDGALGGAGAEAGARQALRHVRSRRLG